MQNNKGYFLGLDIGTNSVGYAVTDDEYNLLKFKGEPVWGVTVFDEASTGETRRAFRTARRRLDRRKQRVQLINELFAKEISSVDENFFKRLQASYIYPEDKYEKYSLFNDENYNDIDYHNEYPTIHHLIYDLMTSDEPHDVRLVYLACAYLVSHRGHFLSNLGTDELSSFTDFSESYRNFKLFFENNCYDLPWGECDEKSLEKILKSKTKITAKKKELVSLLFDGKNPPKEASETFPFSKNGIITLLAGGSVHPKELFATDEYSDEEKISLDKDDETFNSLAGIYGDNFDLLAVMRSIYDWSILADILTDSSCISEAKIKVYEQHKKDLSLLKNIIAKYKPEKYSEVFRSASGKKNNYAAYVFHTDEKASADFKKIKSEEFSKYILGILKDVTPKEADKPLFDDMISRLSSNMFLPKQRHSDNRVIPHQLYLYELRMILKKAEKYLPFLLTEDSDGINVSQKIESIFLFKIPYFVGPLNKNSDNAWSVRTNKKIYPWNFEKVVDFEESEHEFIKALTNTCTYIPGEPVLPKDSLLYHKYEVLNEINNIRINGEKISVELKQRIFNELFLQKKKVTPKHLIDFLISNGIIEKGEESSVSGIDIKINSNLKPQIDFRRLSEKEILTEEEIEEIIERASFSEDKSRFGKWISKEFSNISEADRKYICSLKFKDFGRLSRKLLSELEGIDTATGEVTTIIRLLWETQDNFMEIISSEKYTFKEELDRIRNEYYSEKHPSLSKRLEEMYISPAVKRPIYRTLDILKDIEKVFGKPSKIFVEVTREAAEEQKNKRTKTRKQQIEELYKKCRDEDVRTLQKQLEEMGDKADTLLQKEKLFLYYMQLGKCMYTGKSIQLEELKGEKYNIEHIYPRAFVKDDSIINNKVLVLSTVNGQKSNDYPINSEIRQKMKSVWENYKKCGLISEEKFKRLTRSTAFTAEEKLAFINRQLVQTSQSVKAVATLLKDKYSESNTKIVYSKASVVSDFRNNYKLYKSREFNELHHAKDAYLNIVVGNVYDMKFNSRQFDINSDYSINVQPMFTHPLVRYGKTVWDGQDMLRKVIRTVSKNSAHFTVFSYIKSGKLFDIQPRKKGQKLIPLKKGLDTEKYGGYAKPTVSFFVPVKYTVGKNTDVIIMSVETLHGKKFLEDASFAEKYTSERLLYTLNKQVDALEFPLGRTPLKINTVFSFDGYRACVTGISNAGKELALQSLVQFAADDFWCFYIKKLSHFKEKTLKNPNYVYSEQYDNISKEKNYELYLLYIDKLEKSIYSKRRNSPLDTLKKGAEIFKNLSINEQVITLLNIHSVFCRNSNTSDLHLIGGSANSSKNRISSKFSNWKSYYSDVRIIDSSPSGLWEKASVNLIDLL